MLYIFSTFFLTFVLARLVWIDIQTLRLPDIYTLPLVAFGLILSILDEGIGMYASVLGGSAAFVIFWVIGLCYYTRTGVEGLGLGDAKLFAACGTWLGVTALPYVLLIAALSGLLYALLSNPQRSKEIPFGPWLALGFWAIWVAQKFGINQPIFATYSMNSFQIFRDLLA